MYRRSRSSIPSVLTIVAAMLMALVVAEFAARLALPDIDPTRQISFVAGHGDIPTLGRPKSSLRLVKNSGDFNTAVRFNRHGFRDAGDVADSQPDDIVVVGDSFMLGWGVEEEERTSNRLAQLTGRRVYNIAIPTDIDGFERLLDHARRLGGRFGHVVVGVTMEMVLRLYGPQPDAGSAHPSPPPAAPANFAAKLFLVKSFFRDHSALYFLLTNQVHNNALLEAVAIKLGLLKPNLEGIHEHEFQADVVESTADRLATLGRRYDMVVLILPSRALWHGAGRELEARRHEAFITALAARGIDTVDVRPAMEAGGDPLAFHFRNDGHWRAVAHDMAAQALARRVEQRWPRAGD